MLCFLRIVLPLLWQGLDHIHSASRRKQYSILSRSPGPRHGSAQGWRTGMGIAHKGQNAFSPSAGQSVETRSGVAAAAAAFGIWGLMPLYWRLLGDVPPLEVICHRGLWSFVCLLPFVLLTGRLPEVRAAFAPRSLLLLVCTTALLSVNWLIFVWAVNAGQVLETSLGNFINPLCNMLCGAVFFRDRLRPLQGVAVALAVIGVGIRVLSLGYVPWVALSLAGTFSLYGMLRKIVTVESVPGMFIENAIFLPFSLSLIAWFSSRGELVFGSGNSSATLLLLGAGIATSVPMGLFAYGARHLTLTTLGLLHYVVPTFSFILGIFVFNEEFTMSYFVTFVFIWAALAVYTVDGLKAYRRISKG